MNPSKSTPPDAPSQRRLGGPLGLLAETRKGLLTRAQLSQVASVSTRTIARIEKDQSRRAHPEIVARLAVALSRVGARVDLRQWMEAAGAGSFYEDDLEHRTKLALERDDSSHSRSTLVELLKPNTLGQFRGGKEVACYILDYGAGRDPGSYFTQFLRDYLELLLSLAGRRLWKYRCHQFTSFGKRFEGASSRSTDWGVAIGLLRTEARMEQGVSFLPIPGWSFRLNAVYDQSGTGGEHRHVSLNDIEENLTRDPEDRVVAIVAKEEASASYLKEVCGYRDEIVEVDVFGEDDFFREYERLREKETRRIVIVGDELMCCKIIAKQRAFRIVRPFGQNSPRVGTLPDEFRGSGLPRYDLSLAAVSGDRELLDKLRETQETMFHAAGWKLAGLYSTLIAHLYLSFCDVDLRTVTEDGEAMLLRDWVFDSSFISPIGLEESGYRAFRAALAERLYHRLRENLPNQTEGETSEIVRRLLTPWQE